MTLPVSFLDEIRARIPLAQAIGQSVKLTRKGREYLGLCPFHNEKTASFTVNEDKGFFHCFSCGAHGDVIGFLMRSRHMSFPDAVEQLAGQAGLEIPRESEEERQQAAKAASLHAVLEQAAIWFERQLQTDAAKPVRDYLDSRGIEQDTIARFRLGYAPGSGLRRALGISPEDLLAAGLGWRAEDGTVREFFRNRIVLPITDRRGRIIAFGARALGDEKPKYLNSAASPLFDKSATLYGLAIARAGAASAGQVVAVEGYFDVIAMHQAGFENAVAPLGTALTEQHLEELWRLAPEAIICFDADTAGQRAKSRTVERVLPVVKAEKLIRFADLQGGKDPAELLQHGQRFAIEEAIATSARLADAIWDVYRARFPGDAPEHLALLERALYSAASIVPDPLLRRQLLGDLLEKLRTLFFSPREIFIGRSQRKAPKANSEYVLQLWDSVRDRAENLGVYDWLFKNGLSRDAVERSIGGVGMARGKFVKGRHEEWSAWTAAPRPALWEFGDTSLVILPAWETGPGSALLDLVGWDPRSGAMGTLTGHSAVLNECAVSIAFGFEARGLAWPLRVASSPLSWMRKMVAGENAILVVDWSRSWEMLGGIRQLVAETVELGEEIEQRVRPPQRRMPEIMVEGV